MDGAPLLLVVDNAEDPLQAGKEVALEFTSLLVQVRAWNSPHILIGITTQTLLLSSGFSGNPFLEQESNGCGLW